MKTKLTLLGIFTLVLIVGISHSNSLIAKSRLMTLEEIRSFESGFGTEQHCGSSDKSCRDHGAQFECCLYSGGVDCPDGGQGQECKTTSCGGCFDDCDKSCEPDDPLDCGDELLVQCLSNPCYRYGVRIGNFAGILASGYSRSGSCGSLQQCHTVSD